MERELVSVCGLYCGICPIHEATNDRALAEKIASRRGNKLEDVHCAGCRAEKGIIPIMGPAICQTYDCSVNRKKVEFCFQCDEFPCLKLAPCADRANEIPNNMKIYNLLLIQKNGLEKWLKEAENIQRIYCRGKKKRGGDEPILE